jgi:hypothetical protein|tara:strand:+ start:8971 stop:10374 length:1404 start_codon:yes stop_codon:yes gene_type:complete
MQHIPDYQQFKKNITEGKVNEGKGQDLADKYVAKLRSEFKKLNDDELDEFKKTIAKSLDLKESVNEGKNAQETIIDGLKLSFQTFFEAGVESDYKMFEKFWKRDYKDLVNAAAKIKVSMRESVNEAQFKHINKSEHKIKLAIKDVEKKSRLKVNRDKEPEYEQLSLNKIMLSKVLGRERLGKEHVAAWEKLKKEYELTESVNEAKMDKEFAAIAASVKKHDLLMKISNELFPKIAKEQKDGKFVNFKPLSQKQRDQVYAEFTKRVTDALKESVNERFKHNDMYAMLDIAAQYSSTQHQAANQMWSDEQDLYDYLKSDHIPKKYHKDFYNDVKRRFKGVNESVNEGQNNPVDKKFIRDWEKLCLAMIGRLKIDMRKAPVESKSLFTKNIKRIEDVLDVPTEISYFTEGNGLVKEGLSKSAIKKQIKIVSKMIEDEEGGDGEPLTNETLQDLGRELIRLKSLIESYRMS